MSNDGLRRHRRRDFFADYDIIFELPISNNAKLVYLYLCRCADKGTEETFPSRRNVADNCGIKSVRTVDKVIRELTAAGLITKEQGSIVIEEITREQGFDGNRQTYGFKIIRRRK